MRVQLAQQAQESLGTSDLVMITESVDDVALLIGQLVKMGLPEVLDRCMASSVGARPSRAGRRNCTSHSYWKEGRQEGERRGWRSAAGDTSAAQYHNLRAASHDPEIIVIDQHQRSVIE